mmetsp:Transcript_23843/g.28802  ORF Transcript_23843/g.28802 Transcript_23843/m.28802 type:complete len:451 (+) Transcript_23843:210-1562(+)|eukprot:CAMPEP_0197852670 /NCGR_PEP_ID=MMETSP1438-20131217/21182_1 /TAXON_ID=1461541 /ORGANISM="Pterosperma sp., Strain CCMP1384" /LENGTH=450 /DNA_ID=CAMNT_0043466827 /DNA_START=202 /DNA_END=1554 /DNA_ORIENTATION=-
MIGASSVGTKALGYSTAPELIAAGKVTSIEDEGAKNCIQQDYNYTERPPTPDDIKKYRKSTLHEPGKIVKHYGASEDQVPYPANEPFGIKTVPKVGENVESVIANYPTSELMQWRLDRQEDVYASSKREPLGKSMLRGHKLPEAVGGHASTDTPFGVHIDAKTLDRAPPTKDLLHPVDVPEQDPDGTFHASYVKTHGDYAPGEQRRRNYDWEGCKVDPEKQVFGIYDPNPYREGVAKALNPEKEEGSTNAAKIVPKRLEDFKVTATDELGKTKSLGHGDQGVPGDHTYGVPSRRFEEWGVRRLMQGDYADPEQAPDADLGKSIKKGFRNVADEERVFGAPTIRTDIGKRGSYLGGTHKAFADNNDYGEEPDASALLYPPPAAERGVNEEHYLQAYSKEQLREFLGAAGVTVSSEFDLYFQHAADMDKFPGGGKCCIHTYQKVKRHFECPR